MNHVPASIIMISCCTHFSLSHRSLQAGRIQKKVRPRLPACHTYEKTTTSWGLKSQRVTTTTTTFLPSFLPSFLIAKAVNHRITWLSGTWNGHPLPRITCSSDVPATTCEGSRSLVGPVVLDTGTAAPWVQVGRRRWKDDRCEGVGLAIQLPSWSCHFSNVFMKNLPQAWG